MDTLRICLFYTMGFAGARKDLAQTADEYFLMLHKHTFLEGEGKKQEPVEQANPKGAVHTNIRAQRVTGSNQGLPSLPLTAEREPLRGRGTDAHLHPTSIPPQGLWEGDSLSQEGQCHTSSPLPPHNWLQGPL